VENSSLVVTLDKALNRVPLSLRVRQVVKVFIQNATANVV